MDILLVEDYATTRMVIAHVLKEAGYTVTPAPDGESALDMLENQLFDVVLTDIVMGEVSGIEVLYAAKQQPYDPTVILLTGYGTLETCRTAMRMGAYNYLLKPCPDTVLLASIAEAAQHRAKNRQLLQATQLLHTLFFGGNGQQARRTDNHHQQDVPTDQEQKQQIGALVIGGTRHHVLLHGECVSLTPLEYALLRFLSSTPGKVFRYRDIVQHTHNIESEHRDAINLLRPHIQSIRNKIGNDYVVHNQGVGYRLVDPTPRNN